MSHWSNSTLFSHFAKLVSYRNFNMCNNRKVRYGLVIAIQKMNKLIAVQWGLSRTSIGKLMTERHNNLQNEHIHFHNCSTRYNNFPLLHCWMKQLRGLPQIDKWFHFVYSNDSEFTVILVDNEHNPQRKFHTDCAYEMCVTKNAVNANYWLAIERINFKLVQLKQK